MFDAFAKDHGIDIAPAFDHKLSGDLGRLADSAATAVQNRHHNLMQTTSKPEKNECYSDGSPVKYVWEASASG